MLLPLPVDEMEHLIKGLDTFLESLNMLLDARYLQLNWVLYRVYSEYCVRR